MTPRDPSKIVDRTIWLVILSAGAITRLHNTPSPVERDLALAAVVALVVVAVATTFGLRWPRPRPRRDRRRQRRRW
jgi:hypothetical protein